MTLSCEKVSKRYGQCAVLSDCSLSVAAGECAIIRGPSGGGKSTLLRILALLEPADSGVIYHGSRAYVFPVDENKSRFPFSAFPFLTLVFQQLYLWPNMRIRENIALVVEGERGARLQESTVDLLKRLRVEHVLDLMPHECSLGQRQRAVIARAILAPTQYVLLDEPTSALDKTSRGIVISLLLETKRSGRGLIIVSHDERGFESIADASYELESGKLTPSDSHDAPARLFIGT